MVNFNKVTKGILPHVEHNPRKDRVYRSLAFTAKNILREKRILAFKIEIDRYGNCSPTERAAWTQAWEKAARSLVYPVAHGIVLDHLQVIVYHGITFQPHQHAFQEILATRDPTNPGSPCIPHRSDIAQHGCRELGCRIADIPHAFMEAFFEFSKHTARTIAHGFPSYDNRSRFVHPQRNRFGNFLEKSKRSSARHKPNQEQNSQERKPTFAERTFPLPPVFRKLDSHFLGQISK